MLFDELRDIVGQGELLKAIDLAFDFPEFQSYINQLFILRGRYSKNEIDDTIGILAPDEKTRVINEIRDQFIHLINEVQASQESSSGKPRFSGNTAEYFNVKKGAGEPISIFVGNIRSKDEGRRVESIEWDTIENNRFILTNTLEPNSAKIWHVENKKLVCLLRSKGKLRNLFLGGPFIYGIENDQTIVAWKRTKSNLNQYGIEWVRWIEMVFPNDSTAQIIEQVIYPFQHDYYGYGEKILILSKGKVYSLDGESKWSSIPYNDEPAQLEFQLDEDFSFIDRISRLKVSNGKYAVFAFKEGSSNVAVVSKATNLRHKEFPSSSINDMDIGEVFYDYENRKYENVYYALKGKEIVLFEIDPVKWIPNISKSQRTIDYVNKFPDFIWNIKLFPHDRGELIICYSDHISDFYGINHILSKDKKVVTITKSKFSGHKKKINNIKFGGRWITSSSEDGTIRIWFPEVKILDRFSSITGQSHRYPHLEIADIGCIENCHPTVNPFSWASIDSDGKTQYILAYADLHGYLHILRMKKNPNEADEKLKNQLIRRVKRYRRISKSLWLYVLPIIILYVVGLLIVGIYYFLDSVFNLESNTVVRSMVSCVLIIVSIYLTWTASKKLLLYFQSELPLQIRKEFFREFPNANFPDIREKSEKHWWEK